MVIGVLDPHVPFLDLGPPGDFGGLLAAVGPGHEVPASVRRQRRPRKTPWFEKRSYLTQRS